MLSAKELFKVRHGLEQTVPEKGGTKDFMPQGTWLEDKRLEKFYEEREQILSEPRMQRKADWVKGTWVPEKQLVELTHEMRNFWHCMGFVSLQQKWLYPEEALFLMETNILEVSYEGLSLSIEEAYVRMLGGRVSLEMFQVYSHLRRIGYVVLRHRGRLETTKYERKIGLDRASVLRKHKKKNRKRKMVGVEDGKQEGGESATEDCKKVKTETDSGATSEAELTDTLVNMETSNVKHDTETSKIETSSENNKNSSANDDNTNNTSEIKAETHENDQTNNRVEHTEKDHANDTVEEMSVSQESALNVENENEDVRENEDKKSSLEATNKTDSPEPAKQANRTEYKPKTKSSVWDFSEIIFPDFGIQDDSVVIHPPSKSKLLGNFEFTSSSYTFHRKTWINLKKERRKMVEEDSLSESLQFSYAGYMGEKFGVSEGCRTWAEYKVKLQERMQGEGPEKVVPHLYEGGVSPLVQPEQATCTRSILDQLFIVKEDNPLKKLTDLPSVLPDFDVYLPNVKYKKSQPGVPNLRICVTKCEDSPPDLSVVSKINGYLQDSVPLHWAVIDSGDIAFFSLTDLNLPRDVPLG